MFDALNSIDPVYRPYLIRATVVGSPSREVAAARAARDVMVAMFPRRPRRSTPRWPRPCAISR
jgi:hypothetical protein